MRETRSGVATVEPFSYNFVWMDLVFDMGVHGFDGNVESRLQAERACPLLNPASTLIIGNELAFAAPSLN